MKPLRPAEVTAKKVVVRHNRHVEAQRPRSGESTRAYLDRINKAQDFPRCGFMPEPTIGAYEAIMTMGCPDPHELIGTLSGGKTILGDRELWFVSKDLRQGAHVYHGVYYLYDLVAGLNGRGIGHVQTEEEMLAWVAFRIFPRFDGPNLAVEAPEGWHK